MKPLNAGPVRGRVARALMVAAWSVAVTAGTLAESFNWFAVGP